MAMTDSLRGQLMLWLFPPLVTLLAVDTFLSHGAAVRAVNDAYDRSLLGAARAIADGVIERDGHVEVEVPYSAFEMFEAQVKERIYYSVSTVEGALLSGYADLPASPAATELPAEPEYREAQYRGERIRIVLLGKRLYGESIQSAVAVQVAETLRSRDTAVRGMLVSSIRRQVVVIAITALLVWWGITRGLWPLRRLRDRILAREAHDLSPVETKGVKSEVRLFVDALNQHTARMGGVLAAHEQFISNASHQIRTPLAILKTQSELLRRAKDQAERDRIAAAMEETTDQTVRLTGQLLSLARAEPAGTSAEWGQVRLDKLIAAVMIEHIEDARAKAVDAGLEAPTSPCLVTGSEILLRELFANLIDNAIRYAPAGGNVTVTLQEGGGHIVSCIRDTGTGIAPADRERVFERFVRLHGTDAPGSGLGLAIAKQICLLHRASIALEDAPDGAGFQVRVEFRAAPVAAGPG